MAPTFSIDEEDEEGAKKNRKDVPFFSADYKSDVIFVLATKLMVVLG